MPSAPLTTPVLLISASGRGGSGKSTTVTNAGPILAATYGRRVSLVDLDPQASLTQFLGAAPVADPLTAPPVAAYGCELYRGGAALGSVSADLAAAQVRRAMSPGAITLVDVRGTLYDDGHTGAVLGLSGARLLIVPGAEPRSLPGARKLAGLAEALGVPYRILISRTQRRVASLQTVATLRSYWGPLVVPTTIPDLGDVGRAELQLRPVVVAFPESRVSQAFRAVVADLVDEGFLS